MACFIIRIVVKPRLKPLYWDGTGCERGFPEMFSNREQADWQLEQLAKRWSNAEVAELE